MANFKTGAQRRNDRMDKIWEEARRLGAFENMDAGIVNNTEIEIRKAMKKEKLFRKLKGFE